MNPFGINMVKNKGIKRGLRTINLKKTEIILFHRSKNRPKALEKVYSLWAALLTRNIIKCTSNV